MSRHPEREKASRSTGSARKGKGKGKGRLLLGVVVSVLAACGGEREEPVLVLHAEPGTAEVSPTPVPEQVPEGGIPSTEATLPASDSSPGGPGGVPVSAAASRRVTYEEAEGVFREKRYAESVELFTAYVERVPANPWGHYMLGISAWRAGDHGLAERSLRATLELSPGHEKGTLNLARVLLEQGRSSEALELAEALVKKSPDLSDGWRVLGNVQAELGRRDDAEESYIRAVVLDPGDAWTLNNLGLLRIQAGDPQGALGPLARATELQPGVALFQNNYGAALERGGYLTEAVTAFQAALNADPDHEKARVSLARVQERGPSSPLLSAELEELTGDFDAELRRWRETVARRHEEEEGSGN